MKNSLPKILPVIALVMLSIFLIAADDKPAEVKPLRALMITGGCCHDYEKQKLISAPPPADTRPR